MCDSGCARCIAQALARGRHVSFHLRGGGCRPSSIHFLVLQFQGSASDSEEDRKRSLAADLGDRACHCSGKESDVFYPELNSAFSVVFGTFCCVFPDLEQVVKKK